MKLFIFFTIKFRVLSSILLIITSKGVIKDASFWFIKGKNLSLIISLLLLYLVSTKLNIFSN